jgi:hypothetical protein
MKEILEPVLGRIRGIKRRPCPYYSSYHIEELDVMLVDGTMVPVISKDMTLVAEAEGVKPEFLFDSLREIEVYRDVLAARGLGTAKFYGSAGRSLFLERVDGDLLWQIGDVMVWRAAARWLARLHRTPAETPRLLRYDRAYYRRWMERAVDFHPSTNGLVPAYERAVGRLLQLPVTFIHGEFYASNVIVQGNRICPVDWELAGLGPGLMDLAALTAGEWTDEQRIDLARAYGHVDDAALDACRLHLAVRWLGWAREWTPPRVHKQDWLKEAQTLAAKL